MGHTNKMMLGKYFDSNEHNIPQDTTYQPYRTKLKQSLEGTHLSNVKNNPPIVATDKKRNQPKPNCRK